MGRMLSAALIAAWLCVPGCKQTDEPTPTRPVVIVDDTTPSGTRPGTATDALVITKGDGDLGEADYGQEKESAFTVKNTTNRAISLTLGTKSCACAKVTFDPQEVPAGKTTQITLTWAPKPERDPDKPTEIHATIHAWSGGAEIGTLKLTAAGRVKPVLLVRAETGEITGVSLADLKAGKISRTIDITTEDPAKKDFTIEASASSDAIKLEVSPYEPKGKVVGGHRIKATFGPGLAVGMFKEVITIKTKVYAFPLEVTFEGGVSGGGVTVAPNVVEFAHPHRLGKDEVRTFKVSIADTEKRNLEFVSVDPPFFKVAVEKDGDRDNAWKVTVTLPGDIKKIEEKLTKEQIERLFEDGVVSGGILFKTDKPEVPTIRVPISDMDLLPAR